MHKTKCGCRLTETNAPHAKKTMHVPGDQIRWMWVVDSGRLRVSTSVKALPTKSGSCTKREACASVTTGESTRSLQAGSTAPPDHCACALPCTKHSPSRATAYVRGRNTIQVSAPKIQRRKQDGGLLRNRQVHLALHDFDFAGFDAFDDVVDDGVVALGVKLVFEVVAKQAGHRLPHEG